MVVSIQTKIDVQNTIDKVANIFEPYIIRAPGGLDKYTSIGKNVLRAKILKFIEQEEPISFIFPGFPAKSANIQTKVLGTLPDGAEEVSFLQFAKFANEISGVYKQGISINVISDGYLFNDLVKISDATVEAYEKECKSMVRELPIKWYTIQDIYHSTASKVCLIEKLLVDFGTSEVELNERIQLDSDTKLLYNGMHIFMQHDILWSESMSKNKIKESAKVIAKEIVRRSEAYSRLIKEIFPDPIRLSCHPSVNDGSKYSWRFVPGETVSASPWHNALCINPNGSYTLRKRFQAEESGLELVIEKDRPYFFRQPGTDVGIKR